MVSVEWEAGVMKRYSILGLISALVFVLTASLASSAKAQEILTLRDGTTLVGKAEKEQGGKVIFRTEGGVVIELFASDVAKIERSSAAITGRRYRHDDPNYTRLLWAPTARTLKAGNGYFADYYVFFPTLAYAVTDRFTLYGAMSIIPFVDIGDQLSIHSPARFRIQFLMIQSAL